jgi:hypothetical protein
MLVRVSCFTDARYLQMAHSAFTEAERRVSMKTILTAALALAALTSTVLAGEKYELTDVQMDQVTAGSCGVGSQCFVGAVDRANSGQSYGLHDTTCTDVCVSYSGGGAWFNDDGNGGGGARFVVDGTVLQTGGCGVGGCGGK